MNQAVLRLVGREDADKQRALEAALAAVQVAEAAAAEAVAPLAAEGNTARPGVEDRRTSLVTALAAVRAHLENEAGTVAVQIQ